MQASKSFSVQLHLPQAMPLRSCRLDAATTSELGQLVRLIPLILSNSADVEHAELFAERFGKRLELWLKNQSAALPRQRSRESSFGTTLAAYRAPT